MAHCNTVVHQLLKLFPRHEFELLAKEHHAGRKFRTFDRWSQFVAMTSAQLSARVSLRDLVSSLSAQSAKLYHLGLKSTSRTTLARVNNEKPHALYEELFSKLLKRCRSVSPKHKFKFRNKLYSIDASVIDLCLSVFPWADYRATKGAIKLHVGLDHSGYLPTFVAVTDGKTHEITWARTLKLPRRSIVVFDRAYIDFKWLQTLINKDIFFVTRLKKKTRYDVIANLKTDETSCILSDQSIRLTGTKSKNLSIPLRRVEYKDPVSGKVYVYMTNAFHMDALIVADIYKERWQIEIFFKWIKQNLKIKSFLGTGRNAVMTQIWIALSVYLLLAWIKFQHKLSYSMQQMLRLLQLNLYERRDMLALLRGDPIKPPNLNIDQLALRLS